MCTNNRNIKKIYSKRTCAKTQLSRNAYHNRTYCFDRIDLTTCKLIFVVCYRGGINKKKCNTQQIH